MDLVVEAAKLVGIHEAIIQLPHGYDTVISEDEPLLSAGRRKCVALARTFYGWPSLIILDEPEPHLDRQQRRMLNAAIQSLRAQGAIVVVTTQLKNTALSMAQKIYCSRTAKLRFWKERKTLKLSEARGARKATVPKHRNDA
jgi:ABC-type protease/lipase transport system fused ATPase/permease subunit